MNPARCRSRSSRGPRKNTCRGSRGLPACTSARGSTAQEFRWCRSMCASLRNVVAVERGADVAHGAPEVIEQPVQPVARLPLFRARIVDQDEVVRRIAVRIHDGVGVLHVGKAVELGGSAASAVSAAGIGDSRGQSGRSNGLGCVGSRSRLRGGRELKNAGIRGRAAFRGDVSV